MAAVTLLFTEFKNKLPYKVLSVNYVSEIFQKVFPSFCKFLNSFHSCSSAQGIQDLNHSPDQLPLESGKNHVRFPSGSFTPARP